MERELEGLTDIIELEKCLGSFFKGMKKTKVFAMAG